MVGYDDKIYDNIVICNNEVWSWWCFFPNLVIFAVQLKANRSTDKLERLRGES